jgi:hypothetical protein
MIGGHGIIEKRDAELGRRLAQSPTLLGAVDGESEQKGTVVASVSKVKNVTRENVSVRACHIFRARVIR